MIKTLHDRYCEGLAALGMVRTLSRNKYTMFKNPDGRKFFFVGSSGALRVSIYASAASSLPCSKSFKQKVLDAPTKQVVDPAA